MVTAQNWLDNLSTTTTITNPKTSLTKIVWGAPGNATEVQNPRGTGKLTGPLKIEGYTNLEEINLSENEISEVEIIDCPKLKKINFTGNKITKIDVAKIKAGGGGNEVEELNVGGSPTSKNDIGKLDLTNFVALKSLFVQHNTNLHQIMGLELLTKLVNMNTEGAENIIRYVTKGKLEYWQGIVEIIKEIMGEDPKKPLPDAYKNSDGSFNPGKIKDAIINKVNSAVPSLTAAKEQAEKERDAANANYNQLKQQLDAIKQQLGLKNDATPKQITDEINNLKGRPTTSCSHTDYDAIKAERDRLKSEVDSKKRRIAELESKGKESIKVLTDATNTWGMKFSDDQKQTIQNASTAQEVNEVVKTEVSRLKDENSSSHKLNIGLGVLTIGSLLVIVWMLMKQTSLPEVEPNKKKKQ